ncbi:hypothetical protein AZI86_01730 [Bdellovibrio bacteriovorus]|uniref:OmpA-like domain-containing protein n=1 Tax=Bdellovibrio bacteriovorus TaxID=959 RepID=A0A150WNE7_BDEBC|nr:flagellar motor protein MotB [Bdellovibrio bacteriovorus]KYG65819.1 hypothetical protein AZI86_01730 [Bdellovibrio bacteriovorus]
MGAAKKIEPEHSGENHIDLDDDIFGPSEGEHTDDGEGNWLISYADLMTLLMGFFVVLQSFSTVDASKLEEIKKETTQLFGGEYKLPYEDLSKSLEEVIKEQNLSDQVIFHRTEKGVEITFKGALFFDSGSYVMRQEAVDLLLKLVPVISEKAKDFGIVVEGHTDSRPLSNVRGPLFSNWELSGVRASAVVRMFLEQGFSPKRIKALGLADSHPLFPEKDEKGNELIDNMAQNRRVIVKILKEYGE